MSNIYITSDVHETGESKVLFEIVSKGPDFTERSCHKIDKGEFLSKGIELKLGFRGEEKVEINGFDESIINTETFPTEDGRDVILKIGRKKFSSVRVVVEYNNNMPLNCLHMISDSGDYICERKCSLIESETSLPAKTIDSSLNDENFELDDNGSYNSKDNVIEETVVSNEYNNQMQDDFEKDKRTIDGTLYYVVPAGQRQPRNICLNGIRVKLYNEDNKLISTRITRRIGKKNGYFKFTGLDKGEYSMKILLPSNLEFIHGRDIVIGSDNISIDLEVENLHDLNIGIIKKI